MRHFILEQLQVLSDTPLRIVSHQPGRLNATGQVRGGLAAHLQRIDGLEAEVVDVNGDWSLHRLDELGAVVSCTGFGGLLIQQVPDVETFVRLYLRP